MDCKGLRERLDRYVDGELSTSEADEARAHTEGCASCAQAVTALLHLRSSLKRVVNRHRPPPGLEAEVLRGLRARESKRADVPFAESRRAGTPVWRAKVVVPAPFFALLVLALVVLAGWLVYTRGPARGAISTKRPAPTAATPPAEASGGFDFSRYDHGERASIRVVRRAAAEGARQ